LLLLLLLLVLLLQLELLLRRQLVMVEQHRGQLASLGATSQALRMWLQCGFNKGINNETPQGTPRGNRVGQYKYLETS